MSEMPISHTCPICLTELARARATPEPHYGLTVVVCPGCSTSVVRQRHPDRVFWQQMRRLHQSARQLFVALLFTAMITGAIIGMILWVKPELTTRRGGLMMPDMADPRVLTQLMSAALIVLLCGCIARPLYAHRRLLQVLGLFVILIAFFLYSDELVSIVLIAVRDFTGADTRITRPTGLELRRRAWLLAPILLIFAIGLGLGTAIQIMIERGKGKRIIKLRRKMRKRRARLD